MSQEETSCEWDEDAVQIAKYLAEHHYGGTNRLTNGEKRELVTGIQELLDAGLPADAVMDAIQHGMDEVWPFSEGQPWDIGDLVANITKAKAAAARKRRNTSRRIITVTRSGTSKTAHKN